MMYPPYSSIYIEGKGFKRVSYLVGVNKKSIVNYNTLYIKVIFFYITYFFHK